MKQPGTIQLLPVRWMIPLLWCLLAAYPALSQNGAGSSTLDNGYRYTASGDTTYEYSETLYIGPNAVWNISGTHIIYSKFIWIAPSAEIELNTVGTVLVANPDNNSFYPLMTGSTTVDGNNGNPIGAVIVHDNPNNIILSDVSDPGFGTSNPIGANAAALHIGNEFRFNQDGADIILNNNNLITSGDGTLTGYSASRMVVTGNNINGHLVRLNGGQETTTVFPVGIAEGDYTPATIAGTGDYHVSVTDYAASTAVINLPEEGMDRAWHIFGDPANTLRLQHNSPATDGAEYIDASAYITRYQGLAVWSTGTPEQITTGIHENTTSTAAGIPALSTSDGAWLTKTSDLFTPLPVYQLRFSAAKNNAQVELSWTNPDVYTVAKFEIEKTVNGSGWTVIGSLNANANQTELRFMDPSPGKGELAYRIKIIDKGGGYRYSPVRSVRLEREENISIYPNPVKSRLLISGTENLEVVEIFNVQGNLIKTFRITNASAELDLSGLGAGVYFLKTIDHLRKTKTFKLYKQR